MLRNIDYKKNQELVERILKLEYENIEYISGQFNKILTGDDFDFKNPSIEFPDLVFFLNEQNLFKSEISGNNISLELFLHLYVFCFLGELIKGEKNYKAISDLLQLDNLYESNKIIREKVLFTVLIYSLKIQNLNGTKIRGAYKSIMYKYGVNTFHIGDHH